MDMFRSVVAPVVKENPVFTDFLLTVLYPVCCTQFCCDSVPFCPRMEEEEIWSTDSRDYELLGIVGRVGIAEVSSFG